MKRLLVAFTVLCLVAPALADDLYPPPWRGASETTFQHWQFTEQQQYFWVPEIMNNPYGTPYLATSYLDEQWYDTFMGREGVMNPYWNFVEINLPNSPTPNDWKLVYFQITYWPFDDSGVPVAPRDMWTSPPASQQIMTRSLLLSDGWTYESWEFWIPGNPSYETMTLNTGEWDLYTDQIVIDTICIPEPASLLLLGLSTLVLRRR